MLVSPSVPLALNTAGEEDQDASTSGDTSKSEPETVPCTRPKIQRKPRMSMVILKAMEDNGMRHCMSLAALKKAVATKGYNIAHNTWHIKRVIKNLVDKGMLKQVTGKGALGSFRLSKKQAFKSKFKAKRQRGQQKRRPRQRQLGQGQSGQGQSGQGRSGQGQSGQGQSGQGRSGQQRSRHCQSLRPTKGHKRLPKGVRRGTKGRRN